MGEEDNKDNSEKFDIKEIYTPLSVAEKEIRRRWEDKDLRKKVEDFLGGDVPEFLKDGPIPFLCCNLTKLSFAGIFDL